MTNIKIICDRTIDIRQICDRKICFQNKCDPDTCHPEKCSIPNCEKEKCDRRKREICEKKKLQKGRTCFWKSLVECKTSEGSYSLTLYGQPVEFISISDILSQYFEYDHGDVSVEKRFDPFLPCLFCNRETDIIIINWDSINDDPVYGSEKTHHFFEIYQNALKAWVKSGGILILESQSHAWKTVQEAYDLFDSDVIVTEKKGTNTIGSLGKIKKENLANHPIIEGIEGEDIKIIGDLCKESWFPAKFPIKHRDPPFIQACDPDADRERLYLGWFEGYTDEWEPIIYTDHHVKTPGLYDKAIQSYQKFRGKYQLKKMPIMLCKIVSRDSKPGASHAFGAFILTTMYLGSSGNKTLLQNLLNLDGRKLENYYYRREELKIERQNNKRKKLVFNLAITIYIILTFVNILYYAVYKINNDILSVLIAIEVGFAGAVMVYLIEKKRHEISTKNN